MKKVLFVIHGLGIGGIETCLVNLINALPSEKIQIDLLLEHPIYIMRDRIKAKINYVDVSKYIMDPSESLDAIKQHGGIMKNLFWFIRYAVFRVLVKIKAKKKWQIFKKLPKKYDVAIAYSQEGYGPYYVIDKVSAKKKVLWYHAGVYEYPDRRYQMDLKYYPKYNSIVCVSKDNKEVFNTYFANTAQKTIVLNNVIDVELIKDKSTEFFPDSYKNSLNIVTVGRMVEQKRPDIAVKVCSELIKKGHNIKWHWIGDGEDRESILSMISTFGLEDVFILEGNQPNPYPYISCADIYVQTSRHEAFCTTIMEAKVLCKPIVATDVCGVRDQIEDNINGLITEAKVNAITQAVDYLIRNAELRNRFKNELQQNDDPSKKSVEEYLQSIFL